MFRELTSEAPPRGMFAAVRTRPISMTLLLGLGVVAAVLLLAFGL